VQQLSLPQLPAATADPASAKAYLRQHFRQLRQGLDRALISQKIVAHLASCPQILAAKAILAYVAFGSEVDLGSLFVLFPEKQWGIPRCLPQRQLRWHRYNPAELVPNRWGLLEPSPTSPVVDPGEADLILVPALACDRWGRRLGYGGGYYDWFLASLPNPTVPKWGIVPQACLLEQPLPCDPWDQRLDGIQTEEGFYPARNPLD
jgi:5-formyltetrahydrofolate cyclo-ligase